jgi:GntR family transcriptional regulator
VLIRIDPKLTSPLFEQIAAQVRRAIVNGEVEPGERLSPARDVAQSLGVNLHTVLRAYNDLRDEGLLDVRRGRGVTVTDTALTRAPVVARAREFIATARRIGMTDADIRRTLEGHL